MIINALAHLLITTFFLQIVPVDARDFEQRALSVDGDVPVSAYDAFTLSQPRLPLAQNAARVPVKRKENSLGVVTSAQSAIVVDRASGAVLFQKNIEEPRSIGSVTKLMSALVFLETNPNMEQRVGLLAEDVRSGGVQHVSVNDTFTIRDLLFAGLVSSDNTSIAALVRLSNLSQGDFVARMNEYAAEIGMEQTRFADATGLLPENQSVVQDLARLLDEAGKNELIKQITQTHTLTIYGGSGRAYSLVGTNDLLTNFINEPPYKIEVAKTGFLPEAGYCLGAIFSYEGGREIIVVVLGSQSDEGRFQDVKALAAWAYDTYQWEL